VSRKTGTIQKTKLDKSSTKAHRGIDLDIRSYQDQGYLVIPNTDDEFRALAERADEYFRGLVTRSFRGISQSQFAFVNSQGYQRQLLNPIDKNPAFRDLVNHPRVKQVVQELFGGSRCYITHSKISFKFPGKEVHWMPHQDSGYKHFVGKAYRKGHSVGIFLEDAGNRSGPIEMLPGSHRNGVMEHIRRIETESGSSQIALKHVPINDFVAITGKQGDLLIFSSETVHQSGISQDGAYRPLFIFEVEAFTGSESCEDGSLPVVYNGAVSLAEWAKVFVFGLKNRLVSFLRGGQLITSFYRRFLPKE